jgi:uroporphyrin-III C-methyltransferase/precorrin-2 dehydrogenase/sirohydrochlorin ferrochelatase
MNFFPVFLALNGRRCLVVGGGDVALRKVSLLLKAEAKVTLIAPEICDSITAMASGGAAITLLNRPFEDSDLAGHAVVIAATDNPELNRHLSQLAQSLSVPVNVVDQPELCSFIVPSMIDRSPVQIAISTGGASPVLARALRTRLETLIPSAYGRMAAIADSFRDRVKERFAPEERRKFWERVLAGPIAELVFAGRDEEAQERIAHQIEQGPTANETEGEVYLVGAGPGDPDLLTFRAVRLMQAADVVVYDRLVSPAIMELIRRDAELVYVGKERDNHALPQEEINRLLARLAKEGKRVLRLKGGDPFIFGRGGEEIETLASEGVPFQVVPGITAAAGCASYAGIPLTHRDHSQSCTFVTGHLKDGTMDLNWPALAQPQQTVVFYMGLKGVEVICSKLVEHGLPSSTPAALIQQGTTPQQRVYTSTLAELPTVVERHQIKAPTLIIVGHTVLLRERLGWFEPSA